MLSQSRYEGQRSHQNAEASHIERRTLSGIDLLSSDESLNRQGNNFENGSIVCSGSCVTRPSHTFADRTRDADAHGLS